MWILHVMSHVSSMHNTEPEHGSPSFTLKCLGMIPHSRFCILSKDGGQRDSCVPCFTSAFSSSTHNFSCQQLGHPCSGDPVVSWIRELSSCKSNPQKPGQCLVLLLATWMCKILGWHKESWRNRAVFPLWQCCLILPSVISGTALLVHWMIKKWDFTAENTSQMCNHCNFYNKKG